MKRKSVLVILASCVLTIANCSMKKKFRKQEKSMEPPQGQPLAPLEERWYSSSDLEENNALNPENHHIHKDVSLQRKKALRGSEKGEGGKQDKETNEKKRDVEEERSPKEINAYNVKSIFENYARSLPDYNIEVVVLNRTFEYNDIVLLKLTNGTKTRKSEDYDESADKFTVAGDKFTEEPPDKKIVFIVHALNVVGFYQNYYLSQDKPLFRLMSFYSKHLDKYDIYFMPLANPDGIAALKRDERWSKNYSPQSACNGVALDRNFDISWSRTTENSCSPLYSGPTAFSELESRAIQEVLKKNQVKIHAYFNVRSASDSYEAKKGEALLYPFGYTDILGENEDKFLELKSDLEEVSARGSTMLKFQCDSMYNWYGGEVTGSSVDYAYKVFGVPFAFEVLMQAYEDTEIANAAMNVVWKNVFDAVFKKMSQVESTYY